MQKRWVILEHRISQLQLEGAHFDLLLEEETNCRTWRLNQIPSIDGPAVEAILINSHRIEWLEKTESKVSGNRGWAKRVAAGFFSGELPTSLTSPVCISIKSEALSGKLELKNQKCKLISLQ